MKHLGLGAFSVYLIHVWVPILPAKHWEIPCKGFMLSNITSAHNPLQPRALFFGTFLIPISSALLELRVLQVLLRRVPGASQKRKVFPSTQHCAVQGYRLKTSSRNCPLACSGSDLL